MYEVVWDTTKFNSEWPTDGSQPFYLSTGDNTGLGQHADYVFGWQDDSLQKAMDTSGCMGATCGTLTTQDINSAKTCNVAKTVDEDEEGCKLAKDPNLWLAYANQLTGLDELPGMAMNVAM